MYSNFKLKTNPTFKMEKEEFNSMINSLSTMAYEDSMPVRIGFILRTKTSNMIAKEDNNILFLSRIADKGQGYIQLLYSVATTLNKMFGELNPQVMGESILMPVGALVEDEELIIYFNLIIEDTHIDTFKTNDSINFVEINENNLMELNNRSIIILPTITRTK